MSLIKLFHVLCVICLTTTSFSIAKLNANTKATYDIKNIKEYSWIGLISQQADFEKAVEAQEPNITALRITFHGAHNLNLSILNRFKNLKHLWLQVFTEYNSMELYKSISNTLPIFPSLETFSINGARFPENQIGPLMDILSEISSLKILDLRDNGIFTLLSNEQIKKISTLTRLEELYIGNSLACSRTTDNRWISLLENLPYLKRLIVNYNVKLNQDDVSRIMSLPALEYLDLTLAFNNYISYPTRRVDPFPFSLEGGPFPQIQSLNLTYFILTSLNFAPWTPNIKSLNLSGVDLTNLSFFELFHSSSLEELILGSVVFSTAHIEQLGLGGFDNLRILNISGSKAKSIPFVNFSPNLQQLIAVNSDLGNGAVALLAQLPELQELNLEGTKISANAVKHIAKMPKLRILNLASTNIREVEIQLLAGLKNLTELDLRNTNLSLTDFAKLYSLTQLKKLDIRNLENTNITDQMKQDLRSHLPECSVLF